MRSALALLIMVYLAAGVAAGLESGAGGTDGVRVDSGRVEALPGIMPSHEPLLAELGAGSTPAPRQALVPRPLPFWPSPTPTPAGRWVFYKRGRLTYYNETGNPTALGNEYITGPMDSLAAVDCGDRWLLKRWMLVKWEGGEFVVWAGDICGKCASEDVALDVSPGLYRRQIGPGPSPMADVFYWEEG